MPTETALALAAREAAREAAYVTFDAYYIDAASTASAALAAASATFDAYYIDAEARAYYNAAAIDAAYTARTNGTIKYADSQRLAILAAYRAATAAIDASAAAQVAAIQSINYGEDLTAFRQWCGTSSEWAAAARKLMNGLDVVALTDQNSPESRL